MILMANLGTNDADDVTKSNDDAANIEALGSNDDLQQSTWVKGAKPISKTIVIKCVTGDAVTQIASVPWSSRVVKQPARLIKMIDVSVSADEIQYFEAMTELDNIEVITESKELTLVGAWIGGGVSNINELQVMNYMEAMWSQDRAMWEEYKMFKKFNVVAVVPHSNLSKDQNVMSMTGDMKRSQMDVSWGELNARGCKQLEGTHYHSD